MASIAVKTPIRLSGNRVTVSLVSPSITFNSISCIGKAITFKLPSPWILRTDLEKRLIMSCMVWLARNERSWLRLGYLRGLSVTEEEAVEDAHVVASVHCPFIFN